MHWCIWLEGAQAGQAAAKHACGALPPNGRAALDACGVAGATNACGSDAVLTVRVLLASRQCWYCKGGEAAGTLPAVHGAFPGSQGRLLEAPKNPEGNASAPACVHAHVLACLLCWLPACVFVHVCMQCRTHSVLHAWSLFAAAATPPASLCRRLRDRQ